MRIAVALCLLALPLSAFAQLPSPPPAPFGLQMGATKATVGTIKKDLPNSMFEVVAPKPHADLETYVVQLTPKAGVCWVKAMGKTITTSVYGNELRSEFDKMREQLQSVYGKEKLLDTLRAGSIWNEPKDFMMGLLKKERILGANWSTKDGLELKPGIQMILLGTGALNQEHGYISVE